MISRAASARGVRRRREEAGGGVEIEELDSAAMRQSTYSYFQRKRSRTLADFLDGLSLNTRTDAPMAATDESDADADLDGDSEQQQRRRGGRELALFGGGRGAAMKHFFFGGAQRRPMDRVFRHYAAVANHTASGGDTSGGELVVFQRTQSPSPQTRYVVNLQPYLAMTPRELEALSRQEMGKRVVILSDDEDGDSDGLNGSSRSRSGSGSASSSASSPRFRSLGVPHTDDMDDDEYFDDDVMDGSFLERKPQPYASGEISHSEWFLDDDL
ncbi:hypothetical protein PybrP1_002074 [[Pythium] brassicae (nom. inval.)]|nr:hypothetical protein PybrP1_002074 [[Pythium] brassicae (nom. inval.)]